MPVFEGLFVETLPTLDRLVQDLLYILAAWHAYAKCRIHTQTSLNSLGEATRTLGRLLRIFQRETAKIPTRETPHETEKRQRRKAKATQKAGQRGQAPQHSRNPASKADGSTTEKLFNLLTYKMHALGAYVRAIMKFGTSDNYSTQTVRGRDAGSLF
jgi:Sec-independent protein translocase protein TatA